MKMILLSLFLVLPQFSIFAQDKGILLQKKEAENSDFLIEHKRIKVVTTEGRSFFGRFSIIDDKTISINNISIPLTSIEKIKRKSLTSTIASPIVCAFGVLFILGGTAVATSGGFGAIIGGLFLIPSGFTMTLTALISNKHPKENWEYSVEQIPSN